MLKDNKERLTLEVNIPKLTSLELTLFILHVPRSCLFSEYKVTFQAGDGSPPVSRDVAIVCCGPNTPSLMSS